MKVGCATPHERLTDDAWVKVRPDDTDPGFLILGFYKGEEPVAEGRLDRQTAVCVGQTMLNIAWASLIEPEEGAK